MNRSGSALCATTLLIAGLAAADAAAEAPEWIIEQDTGRSDIEFGFAGGWYLMGFGGEFRFGFPIAPGGAIDYLNESFSMEIGAGYAYWLDGWFHRLAFPVLFRWDFHLTPDWTVYGALGAEGGYPIAVENAPIFGYNGFVWVVAEIGAFLHLSETMSLRLALGSRGIQIGLTWGWPV